MRYFLGCCCVGPSFRPFAAYQRLVCALTAATILASSSPGFAFAQEQTNASALTPEEAEGRSLVTELLSSGPPEMAFYGPLRRVESSEGGRSSVNVRYSAAKIDERGWEAHYEARKPGKIGLETLTILHRIAEPNVYRYTSDSETTEVRTLKGAEANIPFAGSDYWLSDLGLEFLHWPRQRIVKHKITMRNSRPCKVLESTSPDKAPQGYSHVLSWIDRESGALIYAEAYDHEQKRFKIFSLHKFKKVNGNWQPTELEMRNLRTDSRSELEFNFEAKQ